MFFKAFLLRRQQRVVKDRQRDPPFNMMIVVRAVDLLFLFIVKNHWNLLEMSACFVIASFLVNNFSFPLSSSGLYVNLYYNNNNNNNYMKERKKETAALRFTAYHHTEASFLHTNKHTYKARFGRHTDTEAKPLALTTQ